MLTILPAFFLVFMGVLCFVYMILALRTNVVFFLIFLLLTPAFACLAAAYWYLAEDIESPIAPTLLLAGGALAFVVCMLGWWIFAAIMLAALDFPFQLPGRFARLTNCENVLMTVVSWRSVPCHQGREREGEGEAKPGLDPRWSIMRSRWHTIGHAVHGVWTDAEDMIPKTNNTEWKASMRSGLDSSPVCKLEIICFLVCNVSTSFISTSLMLAAVNQTDWLLARIGQILHLHAMLRSDCHASRTEQMFHSPPERRSPVSHIR